MASAETDWVQVNPREKVRVRKDDKKSGKHWQFWKTEKGQTNYDN